MRAPGIRDAFSTFDLSVEHAWDVRRAMSEIYWPVKLLAVAVILALVGMFSWQRCLSPEAAARRRDGALY